MKKYISLALLCFATLCLSAQNYKHSIGGMVGSMYGVSYKGFILGVEHLALQGDLGVRLMSTAAGNGNYTGSMSMYTFELNPNVVYQNTIGEFDEGRVDWYAGGGLSLGLCGDLYPMRVGNYVYYSPVLGKFGLNTVAGAEIVFDAPVDLSLDFRPGYGVAFNDNYHVSFFDWALVASVRYRF